MDVEKAYKEILETPGAFFVYHPEHDFFLRPSELKAYYPLSKVISSNYITIVPGTFNPLHDSHKEIFESSKLHTYNRDWQETDVAFFEISIERVNKDLLTVEKLEQKIKQFKNYAPVIVSKESRFVAKIGAYQQWLGNLYFHIGIDTAARMADDYSTVGIQGLKANFVVYDRIFNGKEMTLETEFQDHVPKNCTRSPQIRSKESMLRSSTEIRENKKGEK